MISQIKGFERDINANRLVGQYNDDGTRMTYQQWKNAKAKSQNILHQEQVGNRIKGAYNRQYRERAKEAERRLGK